MSKWLVALACSFILFSCGNKDGLPKGVLPINKLKVVMLDVFQAEAFTEQYIKKDTTKNLALENAKLQQQIFKRHNVTKESYYKSYNYYNKSAETMKILMDTITIYGERQRGDFMQNRYSKKDSAL
jgi:hypothetical protein